MPNNGGRILETNTNCIQMILLTMTLLYKDFDTKNMPKMNVIVNSVSKFRNEERPYESGDESN